LFPENKIKFRDIGDENDITHHTINDLNPLEKLKWNLKTVKLSNNYFGLYFVLIKEFFSKIKKRIVENTLGKDSVLTKMVNNEKLYYLRISWGCTGKCTYCGINKAIGPLRSKPLEQCISEFKKGLKLGYKEFLLVADDTGAYGIDKNYDFSDLLDEISKIEGDFQICLSSIDPVWLIKHIDSIERCVKKGILKDIMCYIQSGSSSVLKMMKRYNNAEKIKDAFLRLRKCSSDLRIFTAFIVGFPIETEKDVEETVSLIREIGFDTGQLITFSCVKGTEAERIKEKIPHEVINQRFKYMLKSLKSEDYIIRKLATYGFYFIKKQGVKNI